MRQLTINIPDYYYAAFMEYFKRIPEASLVGESDFVLTEEHIKILDERRASPKSEYITLDDLTKFVKGE